jgi:hypothetical protein
LESCPLGNRRIGKIWPFYGVVSPRHKFVQMKVKMVKNSL